VRTVRLMLDETIITETPPLYGAYGHIGVQKRVPITGNRAKRILHGAMNISSGDVLLLITEVWEQEEHQGFLSMVRSQWRGWNIVLFERLYGKNPLVYAAFSRGFGYLNAGCRCSWSGR